MKRFKSFQIRVGCDLVQISRFRKILKRTPAVGKRIFLPAETKARSIASLAGIFAAKEAIVKALRLKAGDWTKIEIRKTKIGRPEIKFNWKLPQKIANYDLSISHDGDYAVATAVFLSYEI